LRILGVRARLIALVGMLVLLLAACAENAPQDALKPAGEVARKADFLWDLTFGIAVAVFVIVEGVLVFALLKFRARPGRRAAQFHGNTRLEVALVVIPALLLAGIGVPTVATVFDLARRPGDALDVKVIGHQFWWEFQYQLDDDEEPELVTANEMHIPTDRPVYLTLEGSTQGITPGFATDVIHSFWVPRLGGAQDLVPGRTTNLTIQADKPGTYLGQCKEFCGLSHAEMKLRVIAQTPGDFEVWANRQQVAAIEPRGALEQRGAELFLGGSDGEGQFAEGAACATCHTIQGLEAGELRATGRIGPDLTHLASRETFAAALLDLNGENLRTWLQNPPAVKEGIGMPDLGLTAEEIDALVAYLLSLR
jgi:cytochrome c oxidase subunit 2